MPTLSTKVISGWACNCADDHPSPDCPNRYRINTTITTDPDWRVPPRPVARADVSRETDLPPEEWARNVYEFSPEVTKAAVKYFFAPGFTHATYARGYPPGDVTLRGECPACHRTVIVILSGDLHKHKCISEESIEGDTGRLQPLSGTIRPVPTNSVIIWGVGWRVIYEDRKFSEAWITVGGIWTRYGATDAARLIL